MMQPDLPSSLEEIRAMARADHAHRLPRGYNPYPPDTPQFMAWNKGWDEEEAAEHSLDEEMSKLPYFRVRTLIVGDARKLAEIPREAWKNYNVRRAVESDDTGISFESREASDRFPEAEGVRIRVEYQQSDKGGLS